jgi:hypothetical protein
VVMDLRLARTRLTGMPDAECEDQRREQRYANELNQRGKSAEPFDSGFVPVLPDPAEF